MKGIVTTYLNKRTGLPDVNANNPGYYQPDHVVEIEEIVLGSKYKDNKVWYRLNDGSFVWSGGVSISNTGESLRQMNVPAIWKYTKGNNASSNRKIKVAVLDTGIIENHIEFTSAIIAKKNFLEDTPNVFDFDKKRHGTHVAGIIAARGYGEMIGVAPECELLVGKIMETVSDGFVEEILIEAINWSTQNEADVISISSGAGSASTDLEKAISDFITERNGAVCAAIGNGGSDKNSAGNYPAKYTNCISVGALNEDLSLWKKTDQYKNLIICAPGKNIKSTTLSGQYLRNSGTSMACPFISGLVALIKSYKELTSIEIKHLLINNSETALKGSYTYRIVNPWKSFQSLMAQ